MKKHISLVILAGLAISGTVATVQSAQAASFTAQDAVNANCVGQTSCTVKGFYLKATTNSTPKIDRTLTQKTVGGVLGIGVRDGVNSDPSSGEIDANEILRVGFGQPGKEKALTLKALDLSFLYQPSVYNDNVFEVALVKADGGLGSGKLRVTGNTSAVWESAEGSVINLSPSIKNKGGSYEIVNPFGDTKIKGFSLTAVRVRSDNPTKECSTGKFCPAGAANSDFALSAVQVPEPTTAIGLGMVGLLALARRRMTKAV